MEFSYDLTVFIDMIFTADIVILAVSLVVSSITSIVSMAFYSNLAFVFLYYI